MSKSARPTLQATDNSSHNSAVSNNSPVSNSETDIVSGTIIVDRVSKRFKKHTLTKRSYSTLKSSLLTRFFSKRFPPDNYIEALQEISFTVKPGEALGIIGRNGSGKSTLLKLISGIYRPDKGSVNVCGRLSALIELGAGFHPDFTGRENIYLGGVMYGLSRREIDAKFKQIVSYAELEDFIDDPVRTYSSGMYMRLGFSLAVHTDPDILLVDEVLAVGDAAFVSRCHDTISELKRRGKTLLFVAHDLDAVSRWCDEVIWLERGKVQGRGEPARIIDSYLKRVRESEEAKLETDNAVAVDNNETLERWGTKEVEIKEVRMRSSNGEIKWLFDENEAVTIEVDYHLNSVPEDLVFGVGILRADGLLVHGTNTDIDELEVPLPFVELNGKQTQNGVYKYKINRLGLVEGSYFVDVAAHRSDGYPYDYHHMRYKFSVRATSRAQGVLLPEHQWEFAPSYQVANSVKRSSPKVGSNKVAIKNVS